jgi:hypothetical protein
MTRLYLGFALAVVIAATLSGLGSSPAFAQTPPTPTPSPTPMASMAP